MAEYSIKDLETLSGINAHTIRVWERRYKLISPFRTETNRRRYSDSQLRKIINIAILRRHNIKISVIASLADSEIEEKVYFLSRESHDDDTQIDTLLVSVLNFNESEVNRIIVRSIVENGFGPTISGLILPFLTRIGLLWQTGDLGIAVEHFISNFIRQKIISAIDSVPITKKPGGKRILLFLPGNEYHEIPLLCYNYLLRKAGHETIYLGAATPLESAAVLAKTWHPDLIVTYIMSGFSDIKSVAYPAELSKSFPGLKVLISGNHPAASKQNTIADVKFVNSFQEAGEIITSL